MFKAQEVTKNEGYSIVTFTDGLEAYGSLIISKEESLYVEFMKFDKGGELVVITEEGSLEEYQRLEEKYLSNILGALE